MKTKTAVGRSVVAGALVCLMGLVVAACSESVAVSIDCVSTAAPAIECEAKQTAGKSEVETCWDVQVECANGAVVKAPHTCVKVKDGASSKVTIPGSKLEGLDKCGGHGPPKAVLSNQTINGKPSQ